MSLLYVTANPKEVHQSYGLQVGERFINSYRHEHPDETIETIDLFAETFPRLDQTVLSLWERHGSLSEAETASIENRYVKQFKRAEKVVFVTPLWNMSIPPEMKAYVDQLIVPGHTFNFTDKGIEGTAGGKKILHIQARGGVYSEEPMAGFEHGDRYLRTIFRLIGIKDYYHLPIEGTSTFPDEANSRLQQALDEAETLSKSF
ncbi:FMN-dependent NADH-azoreductase [Salisediminibacterium halotolerans]|uniref:FMN dependent NADH:quinone oxidoreductase n=1 Tax=Salisediminibacterium halotolerans TaxID=517425 RepID=A0A1H9W804_9BACI|nr:NAD(P)H-dependent oxidoreductase [Salisediminibacterium haloalkalitolerans]SES29911.1 FMN-dependent NADH-azoreductase [Salisediminibacterium haloalkalitolerans]